MKNLIAASLLVLSFNVFADVDCDYAGSQAELTMCASQELNAASKALSVAIEKKCLKDPEVRAWEGGTGYSMVLFGCQTGILKSLKSKI